MAQPSYGDVHVDRPLTTISTAFIQKQDRFIATKVFPVVPVPKQSDKYFTYTQAYWFTSEAQPRAPGSETAGSGFGIGTASYSCDVIGFHKDVDDQTRANADAPINLDRDATEYVTQQLLLKREIDWAATFFATSVWTGSTTGADIAPGDWDTAAGTPIEDVAAEQIAIIKNTGYKPNIMVVGPEVYEHLKNHPDILERIKYTQRGVVTEDLLAGLFDVERFYVAWAVKNSAKEGATASYAFVNTSKDALLVYAPPNPGLLQPSGGYCFTWTGLNGAGLEANRIKRYRLEQIASDRIEGEMAYDFKIVSPTCGAFFHGCVA